MTTGQKTHYPESSNFYTAGLFVVTAWCDARKGVVPMKAVLSEFLAFGVSVL